ncbi:hypothetical protein FV113G1_P20180 (plasmid) [Fusobacterium varium]|nr:hypothetical protein FV113G1_P20180 [Fusobacterium varium]
MEILIDGEVIEIMPIKSGENLLLDKLKTLEIDLEQHSPRLKKVFYALKKSCCVVSIRSTLYFLNLTEEEKGFLKNNIENLKKFDLILKIKDSFVVSFSEFYNYITRKTTGFYIDIGAFDGFELFKEKGEQFITKMYNKIFFDSDYDLNLGHLIRKKGSSGTTAVSKKLQLKDLTKFKDGIRKIVIKNYLEYLGETNYFIKDILEDYISDPIKISVPIDFKLLENAKNKKHLLELKTKKQGLFNRFNKISLNFSYTILKILKHINERELNKVILKEILINGSEREKIKQFFLKYYKEHITDFNLDDYSYETQIVYDYIDITRQLKRKFNLDITTMKKLYKEHDRVAEIQRVKEYKKMELKIKPSNPFLQLELPPEFKMLETKEEFLNEGKENNNCVFSYIPAVNKERCIIYTTLYKGKKYTIEFGKKKTKFTLEQIRGYSNSSAPKELIEYIKNCIKDQRIVKRSNLKHEAVGA